MKPNLPRLLALGFVLSFAAPAEMRADTTSPMFGGSTLSIHGETFQWQEPAVEDGTWHYDTYTSGGYSVTVTGMIGFPNLATVSGSGSTGSVDGHLNYGSYNDNHSSFQGSGSWYVGSYNYTYLDEENTYAPNLATGELLSSGHANYSGPDGSYSSSWGNGTSSWSQSNSGSTTSPGSGSSNLSLFGASYSFTGGSYSSSNDSSGNSAYNWSDQYSGPDNSTLTISYNSDYSTGISTSSTSISGWDPYAGSFSASYQGGYNGLNGLTWDPRTAPIFAPAQLWVKDSTAENYTLVIWQSGAIDMSGVITDNYADSGGGTNVVISGNVREFQVNNGSASVTVNGSSAGSCTAAGFNLSGWNIVTIDPGTTHHEPFFISSTTLWVNGTEYPFDSGHSDALGNRSDTYSNSSVGTVTINGSTSAPSTGSVTASYNSNPVSGSFANGSFDVEGLDIQTSPPPPAIVYGPPAFWLRGEFYVRTGAESNDFASTTAGSHVLTLGSNDEGANITVTGSDSVGSYSGSFTSGQLGVFAIQDHNAAATVAVIPANADGTLLLSGETPPQDMPPGVMVVDGRIWMFVGTAVEDTHPSTNAAYYGSTATANSSPWLLKLRTDGSGTVTYTDYTTATSAPGTYSSQTHLFQTSGPGSGFPVPVYGVEGGDHPLWGLLDPETGLPDTFLVHGEVWHYAGVDTNGGAVYQGYYSGQQLVIGTAGTNGQRLATVTDPVHGNTQGTLNDVRGSVRLQDSTVAYSGNFEGERLNPTFNQSNLHTIAADLDITGNIVSFGSLLGDGAVAGVTMQFADNGTTATLQSALSRQQAQWIWSRAATANTFQPTVAPVMKLEYDGSLHLYSPNHSTGGPSIVLTPNSSGTSRISSQLEVSEDVQLLSDLSVGGDLNVAGAINGDLDVQGNLAVSGSITSNGEDVITQAVGDARYLRSGGSAPVTLANGATIGGATQLNGTLAAAAGATITGATQLNGELSTTGAVTFDAGATITGATQLNGALATTGVATFEGGATVTGATQLNGTLTATGNITANAAARFKGNVVMESGVMVRGVYDGPPEDNKVIMQTGQSLLIPESGDISMGVFRAGPLPETVPAP